MPLTYVYSQIYSLMGPDLQKFLTQHLFTHTQTPGTWHTKQGGMNHFSVYPK